MIRYHALTANHLAQQMQEATIRHYYLGSLEFPLEMVWADTLKIADGLITTEWAGLHHADVLQRLLQVVVIVIPLVCLAVLRVPRSTWPLAFATLSAVLLLVVAEYFAKWPTLMARYLYSSIPAWGVFAAAAYVSVHHRLLQAATLLMTGLLAVTWTIGFLQFG